MKLRKKVNMALVTTIILTNTIPVFAGSIPKINVNDSKIFIKNTPFAENGRTYIPLRNVSENLGAKVDWDAKTQTATITQGHTTIEQRVGSNTARVNNKIVTLDAAAKMKNGATYVPVRFIAETLGAEIKFDQKSNSVNINYDFPKDGGQKYDPFGRMIRTTNLPKNAALFPYIINGVPNDMYEMQTKWQKTNWKITPVEGRHFVKPVNMKNDKWYTLTNQVLWKKTLEENLNTRLNVDYKTVNSAWANELVTAYPKTHKDSYMIDINKYIQYMKTNRLVIEGDYYVEPSMTYLTNGAFYNRVWVKFIVKSDKVKMAKLYQQIDEPVKTNTWYEGYVDLNMGTNNIGSDGSDLTIDFDSITLTGTVKPVK